MLIPVLSSQRRLFSPTHLENLSLYLRSDKGVKSDGAAQFTSANSEYLSIADNPSVSTGDVDFGFAVWVRLNTKTASQSILGKWDITGSNREYLIWYSQSLDRFVFQGSSAGTTTNFNLSADTLGSPSTSTWYFIFAWHDSVSNTVNIQVNNGTVDSSSYSSGIYDGIAEFQIGKYVSADAYLDGRLQHIAYFKNPPSGIAGVISTISSTLYNSGAGVSYENITSAQKTAWGLVSWWKLNEKDGARVDSHGSNHLTDNNTVTEAIGKVEGNATTGNSVVNDENDQSSNGRDSSQSTVTLKPTYQLSELNGLPAISFDGSNDDTKSADFAVLGASDTELSVFMVVKGAAQTAKGIFGQWDDGNNQRSWVIGTGNANNAKLRVLLSDDGTNIRKDYESSVTVFGDGAYHVIGFVYDNGTLSLYIDSTTADIPTKTTDTATTTLHDSTAAIATGGYLTNGVSSGNAAVLIPTRFLYSRAVNASEVSRIMKYLANKYGLTL